MQERLEMFQHQVETLQHQAGTRQLQVEILQHQVEVSFNYYEILPEIYKLYSVLTVESGRACYYRQGIARLKAVWEYTLLASSYGIHFSPATPFSHLGYT